MPTPTQDQMLAVLQDLSDLRRAEQSRRAFLANISHDLRTPLASLQAMIETLQDGALDDRPAAEDFLRRMDAEVQGLNRLVGEFLELTRIESGQLELSPSPTNVQALLARVAARMAAQAQQHGCTIGLALPAKLPVLTIDAVQIAHQSTICNCSFRRDGQTSHDYHAGVRAALLRKPLQARSRFPGPLISRSNHVHIALNCRQYTGHVRCRQDRGAAGLRDRRCAVALDTFMLVALSPREIELLVIVGLALALIMSNRLRSDLVALIVLLALGISGILTPEQAVAGFSRSAVLTIVGLFVITATLEHTGVVQWLADQLARPGGTHEIRMIAVFMGAGALLSLVMNNIVAIGAVGRLGHTAATEQRVQGRAPADQQRRQVKQSSGQRLSPTPN